MKTMIHPHSESLRYLFTRSYWSSIHRRELGRGSAVFGVLVGLALAALALASPDPECPPCPHHGCCIHDTPGPNCTPACQERENWCPGRQHTPGGSVGVRI